MMKVALGNEGKANYLRREEGDIGDTDLRIALETPSQRIVPTEKFGRYHDLCKNDSTKNR